MAGQQLRYYQQAVSEISAGKFYPAYFIFGEETYLIDDLIGKIANGFLGDPQKEMNFYIRYAPDTPLDEILALASGGGLFSAKKAIIYKSFQNLRNPNLKTLTAYLANPNPDICLVVIAQTDSTNKSKFKTLRNMMVAINVLPLREAALVRFIQDEFKTYKKKITTEAVQTLLYLVGDKIHELKMEILQVVNLHHDKEIIEPRDIESVVGIHVTQNVFELTRAIAQKKLEKSLFIMHNLLEKGENPGSIMFFLLRHINMLWKIRGFYQSGIKNDKMIQEGLKIYARQFSEYRRELPHWKASQLFAAIKLLNESDHELKSNLMTPRLVLDRLVFRLVNVK